MNKIDVVFLIMAAVNPPYMIDKKQKSIRTQNANTKAG
jgi:hypothetical protein